MRITWLMSISVLVGLSAGSTWAQRSDDKAAAEQLFTQGRELMEQDAVEQACPKFEASYKLDPALGTLLNLALCNQKQGKVATAWALYHEAADLARRAGQKRREAAARKRAQALQPELPRLQIQVADQGRVPGLIVERDGAVVDTALLGQAVYVDPGAQQIAARAPGYKDFVTELAVEKGKQATVEIPVLEPDQTEQNAAEPDTPTLDSDTRFAAGPAADGSAPDQPGRMRRLIGLGLGGAGVATMVAGFGFGWSAKSTWDDAFSSGLCDADALTCTRAGQDRTDVARSRALASNILVGAGVALAVTGVVLYVTAPRRAEDAVIAVIPVAGPSELGVAVQGGF